MHMCLSLTSKSTTNPVLRIPLFSTHFLHVQYLSITTHWNSWNHPLSAPLSTGSNPCQQTGIHAYHIAFSLKDKVMWLITDQSEIGQVLILWITLYRPQFMEKGTDLSSVVWVGGGKFSDVCWPVTGWNSSQSTGWMWRYCSRFGINSFAQADAIALSVKLIPSRLADLTLPLHWERAAGLVVG